MLSVANKPFIVNVAMLSVVMLNVVAPFSKPFFQRDANVNIASSTIQRRKADFKLEFVAQIFFHIFFFNFFQSPKIF
jgi:hypothetical protein